ncbi:MAG: polysulfide reductase NrfD, partial [Firmicutes bacterium]|nr:polysulfide reductase NrfD [Bacillota bacterium]
NLIIVVVYALTMFNATAAGQEAVRLLTRGRYSAWFFGGVVLVGLVASLALALYFAATGSLAALAWLAAADLVGHFLLFYLLLKAALFSPIL